LLPAEQVGWSGDWCGSVCMYLFVFDGRAVGAVVAWCG